MKYSVETKEVILRNCKITFDYEVVKVEEYENILIILTKNTISGDVQKQPFNNIIAIDENANVVWRISELTNVDIFYSGFYFNNIDGVGKVLEAR
ncbi:MAG: hypothetical protein JW731_16330, partial [Bacteroidales bacterium]|nr:hypothetical protein [Bacteroidales bacterium]